MSDQNIEVAWAFKHPTGEVDAGPVSALTPEIRAIVGSIKNDLGEGEHHLYFCPADWPEQVAPEGAETVVSHSPDPAREARLAAVIARLTECPELIYSMNTHDDVDPDAIILSLAIRGKGACEIRIPRDQYDGFKLLEMVDRLPKLAIDPATIPNRIKAGTAHAASTTI